MLFAVAGAMSVLPRPGCVINSVPFVPGGFWTRVALVVSVLTLAGVSGVKARTGTLIVLPVLGAAAGEVAGGAGTCANSAVATAERRRTASLVFMDAWE